MTTTLNNIDSYLRKHRYYYRKYALTRGSAGTSMILCIPEDHSIEGNDQLASSLRLLLSKCEQRLDVLLEDKAHGKPALFATDLSLGETHAPSVHRHKTALDYLRIVEDDFRAKRCRRIRIVRTDMRGSDRFLSVLEETKDLNTLVDMVSMFEDSIIERIHLVRKLLKCKLEKSRHMLPVHTMLLSFYDQIFAGIKQHGDELRRKIQSGEVVRDDVEMYANAELMEFYTLSTEVYTCAQLYRVDKGWAPTIMYYAGAAHTSILESLVQFISSHGGTMCKTVPKWEDIYVIANDIRVFFYEFNDRNELR